MALKVVFLTTLGVNVGDEIIREGVRAALDTAGLAYVPYYVDKHDAGSLSRPVEDEPDRVDDKYWDADIVVQAGAPVYWHVLGGKSTSINSEWAGWLWRDRVLCEQPRRRPTFLNLGAGSSQPWGDDGRAFVEDEGCAAFARALGRAASVTTVRDPVASRMLRALGVEHHELPCPALLAAARHQPPRPSSGLIGVNLMPLGAHHDVEGTFDRAAWLGTCVDLVNELRCLRPVLFVAHDRDELEFLHQLGVRGERVAHSPAWRDYLDFYAGLDAVVANRVHGALCAAGFGVPAVILGNDSRASIGDYVGLPVFRSGAVSAATIAATVERLLAGREAERARLVDLRDATLRTYVRHLRTLPLPAPREDVPVAGHAPRTALSFGADWHALEADASGLWRWSPGRSSIDVHVSQPGTYALRGDLLALEPRAIGLALDGRREGPIALEAGRFTPRTLVRSPLGPGHHRITLWTDAPPSSVPGDTRALGFALRNVTLTPEPGHGAP